MIGMNVTFIKRFPCLTSNWLPCALVFAGACTVAAQDSTNNAASVTQRSVDGLGEKLKKANKAKKERTVEVTGDVLIGYGNTLVPVGFALSGLAGFTPSVQSPPRNSTYFGGTVSYRFTPRWQMDVAYSQGTSSGDFTVNPHDKRFPQYSIPSSFTLDDNWLQIYGRRRLEYGPDWLQLYLRAGVTYVDGKTLSSSLPGYAFYVNKDTFTDLTGNFGLGAFVRLHPSKDRRWEWAAVFEAEGFAGVRSRSIEETTIPTGTQSSKTDDLIYGGLGRATLRVGYTFGERESWDVFMEGGIQTRWTEENFSAPGLPKNDEQQSDLLWGPYGRFGLRHRF